MIVSSEEAAQAWMVEHAGMDATARERLERLIALLAEENERQNLVAAASLPVVWQRHIADSAQLLAHVPRETVSPWLDLGTGAGFPGLVIAALRPEAEVVMVESRARRIDWLNRVLETLGLTQARVEGARLELVESFTAAVISARAFAPLDKLLKLSARFSTEGTLWLLPKGRSAAHELAELKGWRHTFHVEHSLTDAEAGVILGHLKGPMKAKSGGKA